MRCTRCGVDTAAGGYCSGCGARLFAWLGDPFGGMELAAHAPAVAMRRAPAGPRTSTAKLLVAVFVIASLTIVSPVWAALLLIAFLVVLRYWPGVGWRRWSLFLGVFVLMAILSQPAMRSLVGAGPRPVPTTVPSRPAAVLTATAISGPANDAYGRGAALRRADDALETTNSVL